MDGPRTSLYWGRLPAPEAKMTPRPYGSHSGLRKVQFLGHLTGARPAGGHRKAGSRRKMAEDRDSLLSSGRGPPS